MLVTDLIVEVRDSNLDRVGQIVPEDLVGATFILRFNIAKASKVISYPLFEYSKRPEVNRYKVWSKSKGWLWKKCPITKFEMLSLYFECKFWCSCKAAKR
jgi:hypothetical protein